MTLSSEGIRRRHRCTTAESLPSDVTTAKLCNMNQHRESTSILWSYRWPILQLRDIRYQIEGFGPKTPFHLQKPTLMNFEGFRAD